MAILTATCLGKHKEFRQARAAKCSTHRGKAAFAHTPLLPCWAACSQSVQLRTGLRIKPGHVRADAECHSSPVRTAAMLQHLENRTVFARYCVRHMLVCYHNIRNQLALGIRCLDCPAPLIIYIIVTNQNAANSTALTTALIDTNNNNQD